MKSSTEHDEQVALFRWAEVSRHRYPQLKLMFAIPNGYNKSMAGAMKAKREGLKAGVPDIFLPTLGASKVLGRKYYGLFVEMKRLKPKGKTSPEQREWIAALAGNGYAVHVCWGWEAARDVIIDYLEGRL